ncbi:bifunctional [glutamine synthetase] adenylyltransferase/[glutamine synthetase]-adenylyl-L-tyrosine phosphorylase [Rhodobacteraceae bacterium KN286]|uniref:Bifunctional [glutamine synthetase] adenylyltransferase/[glutamine synthetase]-adenylyl-L-tyrosine phosphorylase n=2 Tax=Oceanomicrobium pacificus TaxID=2692916 RepID=A0A6B0TP13_9RHOB|nr:bifunctional [glutamine synthetase] adenylyltransferase/[glutamine synthetase]-adenylyl-L-tyrosine phosphorylase [Oceanomicrobium pacificus]
MRLADAITEHPIPHHPERGDEARAAIARDLPDGADALLRGAAGCSPYLDGLIRREADWLGAALAQEPEVEAQAVLDAIGGDSLSSLGASLRQAKRRLALLTALCDLGGVWDVPAVTGWLTRLADRAVEASLAHLVGAAVARGKLTLPAGEGEDRFGGLFAIAMGKMGAGELNYSSDIDLILLFDESRYPPEDYAQVRTAFIKIAQGMVKLLSENTADGYVFRTDLRLRPDPSVTPVCIGAGQAERYYESFGRTWERAAFIKARICAGDRAAGAAFLNDLQPFIWRRHLDFAAIQDAHDMRLRIREHKGLAGPITIPGHDMKLGRGGIREIEFFTQTRQLICGGRDPDLRAPGTLAALDALVGKGWVAGADRDRLHAAYLDHRRIEHRLQMLEDAQTHAIPEPEERRLRLAHFCGTDDLAGFEAELAARLAEVHGLTERFFTPDKQEETAPGTPEGLARFGFARPDLAFATIESWQGRPALRAQRAREIFNRLLPGVLERLGASRDPDASLAEFDAFLRGLPAGVQILSLFEANPSLLDLLTDICGLAPELARYLGRNAGVLEAVLTPDFFEPLPDAAALEAELQDEVAQAGDYEQVLDFTRKWLKEKQFQVGVLLLRQISDPGEAAGAYSDLAECCIRVLLPHVSAHIARRHGPPPGRGAAILAMGKLGSREMTVSSDLDLIVVYDAAGAEQSDGPRPLPVSTYYARWTKALLSALTVQTAEGSLYEVDMRLRPSGQQGPVATSLAAFADYQCNQAWTWEHLALTRGRVVAGDDTLAADVTAAARHALEKPRDRAAVLGDVREMRARLAQANAKAAGDPWEVKRGPGRMLDVELLVQTGALLHPAHPQGQARDLLPQLVACGFLNGAEAETLGESLRLTGTLQQILRLAQPDGGNPEEGGPALQGLLLRATGAADMEALRTGLGAATAGAAQVVDRVLHG